MEERFFAYAQEHHQELLRNARNWRAIRGAKSPAAGLWDDILIGCGNLLIILGQKLKERRIIRNEAFEYYVDPCVECS